ncbi:MAG TPA: outer membrane protein [Xanthobacteraceae bacterium]|jgi:outer membrane immunogenic protein|nr:outer membrane protein [Xanthobacteraceae bacterium]
MKYKGFLLATAGGLAVAPGAQAADMLVKAPLAPVAPSWTGWYIGAHAGAAWQNMSAANIYGGSEQNHVDGSSFIGGGQLGYNWQHGSSVFGIEADISGLSNGPSWHAGGTLAKSVSTSTNWLSTIRGRMGLAVADTMVYATGGVAFGGVKNSQHVCSSPSHTFCTKSESTTRVGWTIGGGVEHMWDAHWTIGLEGLFVDLGESKVSNPDPFAGSDNALKNTTFRNQLVIGRFKLNYKF